eukprot:TRINITY_DN40344_c0_g1_i1.p1 TRINITY_DN40344_c0_g1~~TRINITY_DN40344_c0_g1_i1.p1  ORF type:complete len:232 (-),score=21.20 TRINITY_DN40344_c0_g1_i1:189-884(-)
MACGDSISDSDSSVDSQDTGDTAFLTTVPISEFPPMPDRKWGYWTEPCLGVLFVSFLSVVLVYFTHGVVWQSDHPAFIPRMMVILIFGEAIIAFLCILYLLFGRAGEIKRSRKTCFPLPAEVEQRLLASEDLIGVSNLEGPPGSKTLGSFCSRCLVWRPPSKSQNRRDVHHCRICSRCVVGFDHHCGVFGRCIVAGNMPCFVMLIAMGAMGFLTAFTAMMTSPTPKNSWAA